MHKKVKTAALIPVVLLYCFVLGTYLSGNKLEKNPLSRDLPGKERSFYTEVSPSLFYHTVPSGNYVHSHFKTPFSFGKNQFNQAANCGKQNGSSYFSTFSKYLFYSAHVAVGFKPTDIIFPFHYFW
jgi:hypothetical protein